MEILLLILIYIGIKQGLQKMKKARENPVEPVSKEDKDVWVFLGE